MYHIPLKYHRRAQMEGACVLPHSAIEQFALETQSIHRLLATKNIQIEDETKHDASNPFQACHDLRQAKIVTEHLKATINRLIYGLFKGLDPHRRSALQIRWIPAFFPFTSPSYEVEVFYMGKWLEILGCGVVKQLTLDKAGQLHSFGHCSEGLTS